MFTNLTVLVVNSNNEKRACIVHGLLQEGFKALEAMDDDDAYGLAVAENPDAILLDVMSSSAQSNGVELCRRLRTITDAPIILLASRVDELEQLLALAAGADDYLSTSCSSRLLAARLSAVLRRCRGTLGDSSRDEILRREDVHIDKEARTVSVKSIPISLTRTEFDLLVALAEKPRRVFPRTHLIESVWGEWCGSDTHLDVHMSRLRKKIAEAGGPRVGHAVRGFGFRYSM